MFIQNSFKIVLIISFLLLNTSLALAQCRPVKYEEKFQIADKDQEILSTLGLDKKSVFDALHRTSMPEARGCWASATGNSDGEILSVGVLQWNFGKGTLPELLRMFKSRYKTSAEFLKARDTLMHEYGKILFSSGCLRDDITAECKSKIMNLQINSGYRKWTLIPKFKDEVDALFSSDTMIQVEVDRFSAMLVGLHDQLYTIFEHRKPTPLQIKWAIDTKTQHGSFPTKKQIEPMRNAAKLLTPTERKEKLHAVIEWYDGISQTLDQSACCGDRDYNIKHWTQKIDSSEVSDEQFDLIYLSFIRSRHAMGEYGDGPYQADSFERRAAIILGIGKVHGAVLNASVI